MKRIAAINSINQQDAHLSRPKILATSIEGEEAAEDDLEDVLVSASKFHG